MTREPRRNFGFICLLRPRRGGFFCVCRHTLSAERVLPHVNAPLVKKNVSAIRISARRAQKFDKPLRRPRRKSTDDFDSRERSSCRCFKFPPAPSPLSFSLSLSLVYENTLILTRIERGTLNGARRARDAVPRWVIICARASVFSREDHSTCRAYSFAFGTDPEIPLTRILHLVDGGRLRT